jgi:hypothetical protein
LPWFSGGSRHGRRHYFIWYVQLRFGCFVGVVFLVVRIIVSIAIVSIASIPSILFIIIIVIFVFVVARVIARVIVVIIVIIIVVIVVVTVAAVTIHSCGQVREGLPGVGVSIITIIVVAISTVGRMRRDVVGGIVIRVVIIIHISIEIWDFVAMAVGERECLRHSLVTSKLAHSHNGVLRHWELGPAIAENAVSSH